MTEPDIDKMSFGEYARYCEDLHKADNKILDQKGELTFKHLCCGDWFMRAGTWIMDPFEIFVKSYAEIGGSYMAISTSLKHGKSEVFVHQDFPVKLVEKPEVLK